jgi:hypothetical protein|tara:strand:+ start:510 stop:638 length:129 start_codon:yes stop_codon:yes gene_type:complete
MYNVIVNGTVVNCDPVPFYLAATIANWHRDIAKQDEVLVVSV